jgi:hypothetical protein
MAIDRSNYHTWFIDLIDGLLNEQEILEVNKFLAKNPDLKAELNAVASINLQPPIGFFREKDVVKKSFSNLSAEQFDNLCIAYMENDLSSEQISELEEMIASDEQKRNTLSIYKRLRLTPPPINFTGKQSIKKLTAGQRILRISLAGTGIAATIALFALTYVFLTGKQNIDTIRTSDNLIQDTIYVTRGKVIVIPASDTPDYHGVKKQHGQGTERVPEKATGNTLPDQIILNAIKRPSADLIAPESIPSTLDVKMPEGIIMPYKPSSTNLIALKYDVFNTYFNDDRSNVERFLARFFHEKIMKDKKSGDRPVESFEIAEAGITGLNKLLGWQMELQKNTDENGNVTSYYFSSKLLKFNTPVKKQGKEL